MSVQRACTLTGISRATYYRRAKPVGPRHGPWLPRTPPPQTLSLAEREQVLAVLNAPAYTDLAIPQVWARELDQGRYCRRSRISPPVAVCRSRNSVLSQQAWSARPSRSAIPSIVGCTCPVVAVKSVDQ